MNNNTEKSYSMFCFQCQETAGCTGCTKFGVCGKSPDLARMQDLLIYTTKGLSEVTTRLRKEGEKVDKELRYNIKAKEVENKVTDKNDKEKTVKEIQYDIEGNPLENISEYARFFDEATSTEHHKDAEYNLMFLRRQQDYANEVLKSRGHLFLNEVYDMLGIPRTKAGQVVGWIYNEDNPNGDNYVDFGIYDLSNLSDSQKERKIAFVNGHECNILLDFNVDGPIYDLI